MEIIKKLSLITVTGMLFTSVIASSCRKEEATAIAINRTVIDTVQHAWNQEPATYYFYDQYITNSYAYGNGQVIFMCKEGSYFLYDSAHKQWADGFNSTVGSTVASAAQRIPVYKDYFIEVSQEKFEANQPGGPSKQFQFNQLDTALTTGCSSWPFSIFEHDVDINDSGRVIFPVAGYTVSHTVLLIDIKYNAGTGHLDTSNKKILKVGNSTGSFFSVSGHIKNNFFVTDNSDTTYLITPTYSVLPVCKSDVLFSFFSWNNSWYAIGPGQVAIYQTTDLGQTWTKQFNISTYLTGIFNFDNKLIAFVNDQIFLVIMTSTTITFKEIVNDGLTGKIITSIAKSNGMVYISTNQGIYERPYANFYTYK